MIEIVKALSDHGVPTLILSFFLWFLLKPLIHVLIKNIEAQTEVLRKITEDLSDQTKRLDSIESNLEILKNKIQ